MMGRTFVIGDIHGCHQALVGLLAEIDPDPAADTIVFLGDYIDRGPDSREVLDEILALQERFPRLIPLMGNHEQMFLDYLAGRGKDFFLMAGGLQTLQSYGCAAPFEEECRQRIPAAHFRFLRNLLPCWEDAEHIFVHAGLKPGVHLSQQPPEWLLWAREKFLDSSHDFGKHVVFGHTPMPEALREPNRTGIDTGAVYGGSLSCLVLPERRLVSVACARHWPVSELGRPPE